MTLSCNFCDLLSTCKCASRINKLFFFNLIAFICQLVNHLQSSRHHLLNLEIRPFFISCRRCCIHRCIHRCNPCGYYNPNDHSHGRNCMASRLAPVSSASGGFDGDAFRDAFRGVHDGHVHHRVHRFPG